MHEFSDFINIVSISLEITGFVILLPRLRDLLQQKFVRNTANWKIPIKVIEDLIAKDWDDCLKVATRMFRQELLEINSWEWFVARLHDVHSLRQQSTHDELLVNDDIYPISYGYLENFISDMANRKPFERAHRKFENVAIPLVITGLAGQALSVLYLYAIPPH